MFLFFSVIKKHSCITKCHQLSTNVLIKYNGLRLQNVHIYKKNIIKNFSMYVCTKCLLKFIQKGLYAKQNCSLAVLKLNLLLNMYYL